jgi:hypothetical protein
MIAAILCLSNAPRRTATVNSEHGRQDRALRDPLQSSEVERLACVWRRVAVRLNAWTRMPGWLEAASGAKIGAAEFPAGFTPAFGLDVLVGRTLNAALYGYFALGSTFSVTTTTLSSEGHAGVV